MSYIDSCKRAFIMSYHAPVHEFIEDDADRIVGLLAHAIADMGFNTESAQITTWKEQVNLLQDCLQRLLNERGKNRNNWHIALEYELPRRQKRPDAILLVGDRILVIEFKFGMETYDASARWQAEDYALNLRDFHAASHERYIVPILCAADAPTNEPEFLLTDENLIAPIRLANKMNLGDVIKKSCEYPLPSNAIDTVIDATAWLQSPYRPTLTIIEAAERLYGDHSVREISHSYASNLDKTTEMLAAAIVDAKNNKKRCICFVTGVPGAGKTLTGLNVVHDPSIRSKQGPSGIFLSGNGPLVKIVREALVINQQKAGRNRQDAEHEVSTFIQNVHQFLRFHRENQT
ncbi:MAG: DNA/RNA helicase domain-containing protein, partial [Gammaproteobacteria bacterium]